MTWCLTRFLAPALLARSPRCWAATSSASSGRRAYSAIAEKRLSKVRRLDRGALETAVSKRAEPRVPFGQLVERGMLRPGEMLENARGQSAKVRVDGTLIANDVKGSIHQVGAKLEGAPSCNGWTYWHFKRDGKLVSIDVLRQQIRSELAS